MRNLTIIAIFFLVLSNFLLWNIGKRTMEFTETIDLNDNVSREDAMRLSTDENTNFFIKEYGKRYIHYTEIKVLKTKSFIPMVYTNEVAVSNKTMLRKYQGSK